MSEKTATATAETLSLPEHMLRDYLRQQAQGLFAQAEAARRAIRTPADWAQRRAYLMEAFQRAIGPFPPRTPLNARVVGTLERERYWIEKIIFESRPRFFVTALAYVPKHHTPPFPGILFPLGHSANGKAYDNYQRLPAGLAEKGYLVLTYDPLGQGERLQYWDPATRASRVGVSTREHSYVGAQCLLLGINLAQYMIWDSIRAMDYLLSRPDVDPERIGCTGVSGGGTNTAYYVPFDERVKVSMPTCYICGFRSLFDTILPQDAEQNLFGQLAVGLDHADYLALVAPRPLMVGAATEDYFSLEGAQSSVAEARHTYEVLGAPHHLQLVEVEQKHGYHLPMRRAAYAWFNRWFGKETEGDGETEIVLEPDETLWCTRTGNVQELGSETVFTLNRRLLAELTPGLVEVAEAREARAFQQEVRGRVRRLLSYFPLDGDIHLTRAPLPGDAGVQRERVMFQSEPGILIPGTLRRPAAGAAHAWVVWVDAAGKDSQSSLQTCEALARAGVASFAVDPRGIGETGVYDADAVYPTASYSWVHRMAYMAFLQGRPLLGMRVQDVVRAVDALLEVLGCAPERLVLAGRDGGALLALCAGALDPRVSEVVALSCLGSFRWLAEHEFYAYDVSWFLPGVVKECDVGDMAALLAPRPLTVWGPVDQQKQPVALSTVRQAWTRTIAAYSVLDAAGRLQFRADLFSGEALATALRQ